MNKWNKAKLLIGRSPKKIRDDEHVTSAKSLVIARMGRHLGVLALVLLALTASGSASDVVVLETDTFDSKVAHGLWFLDFYAPCTPPF